MSVVIAGRGADIPPRPAQPRDPAGDPGPRRTPPHETALIVALAAALLMLAADTVRRDPVSRLPSAAGLRMGQVEAEREVGGATEYLEAGNVR